MCWLDVKLINGTFQVCRDGLNANIDRVTGYRECFHAHYLVSKAAVQKLPRFKTLSNISVIEMIVTDRCSHKQ